MARIYRTTDRIKLKIDDIIVTISPLSASQKAEINTYHMDFAKGNIESATNAVVTAMKYAIKDIEGVEDADGKPYELEFDGDYLSDDCVSDLLNLELNGKLQTVACSLANGVPNDFDLEGVEFVKSGDSPN